MHNTFLNNASVDVSLKKHGPITIADCATDSAYGASWIYDPNDSAYTNDGTPTDGAAWHNAFSATFTSNYYLTPGSPGQNAASDGTDCGALNDTTSSSPTTALANGTGTAHQPTVTVTNASVAGNAGTATGSGYVPQASVTVVEKQTQAHAGLATGSGTAFPPFFARLGVPSLTVRVDWDNDGAFTGGYDDVSSRVLSEA